LIEDHGVLVVAQASEHPTPYVRVRWPSGYLGYLGLIGDLSLSFNPRWRGNFRAISYPYTHEGLGVVVRVVEEGEYREAVREGRGTFGMPWPAHQIEPLSTSEGAEQDTQELPLSQRPRQGLRGSLRLIFGG
jgi:hypothetical protein